MGLHLQLSSVLDLCRAPLLHLLNPQAIPAIAFLLQSDMANCVG